MTIESALFSYLSTKASVIAVVGTKIFPEVAPESALYPFITYQVLGDTPEHHMTSAAGLTNVSMQIDVWADTFASSVTISEVIRNALDGFTGDMGSENLSIRTCHLENRLSLAEPDAESEHLPIFRKSMDFLIWHAETVPTL